MDPFCRGIILTILAANDKVCVVTSFNNLFTQFLKANNYLLFTNHARTFSRNYVTRKLQERICALGYQGNYTGHLFRRSLAILARLAGLSKDKIQLLERWRSNCYRLYVETHPDWIHNASQKHQLAQTQLLLLRSPCQTISLSSPPISNLVSTRTRTRTHTQSQIPRPSQRV